VVFFYCPNRWESNKSASFTTHRSHQEAS